MFDAATASLGGQQIAVSTGPRLGSWTRDLATNEVLVCMTGATLFGFEPDAVAYGLPVHAFWERIHKDDRATMAEGVERSFRGKAYDVVYRVQSETGVRPLRAMGAVVRDKQGNPVRFAGTLMELGSSSLYPTSPMDEIVDCFLRAHGVAKQWGFDELAEHCSSGLNLAILKSIRS